MSTLDLHSKLNPQSGRLRYSAALQFPFESAKWIANLAFGSLCFLIASAVPVIGQLVWYGLVCSVPSNSSFGGPRKAPTSSSMT